MVKNSVILVLLILVLASAISPAPVRANSSSLENVIQGIRVFVPSGEIQLFPGDVPVYSVRVPAGHLVIHKLKGDNGTVVRLFSQDNSLIASLQINGSVLKRLWVDRDVGGETTLVLLLEEDRHLYVDVIEVGVEGLTELWRNDLKSLLSTIPWYNDNYFNTAILVGSEDLLVFIVRAKSLPNNTLALAALDLQTARIQWTVSITHVWSTQFTLSNDRIVGIVERFTLTASHNLSVVEIDASSGNYTVRELFRNPSGSFQLSPGGPGTIVRIPPGDEPLVLTLYDLDGVERARVDLENMGIAMLEDPAFIWSRDRSIVAIVGYDKRHMNDSVVLIDLEGNILGRIDVDGYVDRVMWSPNGNEILVLYSYGPYNTIVIYNISENSIIFSKSLGLDSYPRNIAILSDRVLMSVKSGDTVYIYSYKRNGSGYSLEARTRVFLEFEGGNPFGVKFEEVSGTPVAYFVGLVLAQGEPMLLSAKLNMVGISDFIKISKNSYLLIAYPETHNKSINIWNRTFTIGESRINVSLHINTIYPAYLVELFYSEERGEWILSSREYYGIFAIINATVIPGQELAESGEILINISPMIYPSKIYVFGEKTHDSSTCHTNLYDNNNNIIIKISLSGECTPIWHRVVAIIRATYTAQENAEGGPLNVTMSLLPESNEQDNTTTSSTEDTNTTNSTEGETGVPPTSPPQVPQESSSPRSMRLTALIALVLAIGAGILLLARRT